MKSQNSLASEQQKMHRIYHLFEPYVTTHPAFTIRFLPDVGYLWSETGANVNEKVFHNADEMLKSIVHDVILDITSLPDTDNPEHIDNQLSEREKNLIRQRFGTITKDFPPQDKDAYFVLLEREIKDYPWNPACKKAANNPSNK